MPPPPRRWRPDHDSDDTPLVAIPGTDPHDAPWYRMLPPAPSAPAPSHPAPPRAPTTEPDDVITIDLTTPMDHLGPALLAALAAPLPALLTIDPIASRSTYTSGTAGEYNITLQFKGPWTVGLQNVFIVAAERLSATITGDLPNVRVGGTTVDDIVITAELAAIDGPGGMLGQSGPTALRTGSFLPAAAAMRFDSADASTFHAQALFDGIVTHEMLHAVGFGAIWSHKNLLTEAGFIGPNAMAEYAKLIDAYAIAHRGSTLLANGTTLAKGAVPVESEGGLVTADAHWAEDIFDGELMTGWLDTQNFGSAMIANPLSALTAASLRDLGYTVPLRPPVDLFYLG